MEKKSLWQFGTKEVVYAAIGAALYGVLSYATNFIPLPAAGNITFRPAVAIVFFFGLAFGPLVGFFTGFVGNMLGDFISGFGFWWSWDLGNALMGLIPGLMVLGITSFKDKSTIVKAEIAVVVAAVIGMFVPSMLEIPISGINFNTALGYWIPASVGNIVVGLILVPLLMVAYDAVMSRSGR